MALRPTTRDDDGMSSPGYHKTIGVMFSMYYVSNAVDRSASKLIEGMKADFFPRKSLDSCQEIK